MGCIPVPVQRRRGYSRGAMRRGRRQVAWATNSVSNQSLAAGTAITPVDLLSGLEVGGASILRSTVIRNHLWLSLSAGDTDTNPSVISGIIVWDKTALSATTGPNVSSDFYVPWLHLRELSPGTTPNTTPTPINAPTGVLYGMEYDIKAKRKLLQMNDSLFFLLRNQGSQNISYSFFCRTLIALA